MIVSKINARYNFYKYNNNAALKKSNEQVTDNLNNCFNTPQPSSELIQQVTDNLNNCFNTPQPSSELIQQEIEKSKNICNSAYFKNLIKKTEDEHENSHIEILKNLQKGSRDQIFDKAIELLDNVIAQSSINPFTNILLFQKEIKEDFLDKINETNKVILDKAAQINKIHCDLNKEIKVYFEFSKKLEMISKKVDKSIECIENFYQLSIKNNINVIESLNEAKNKMINFENSINKVFDTSIVSNTTLVGSLICFCTLGWFLNKKLNAGASLTKEFFLLSKAFLDQTKIPNNIIKNNNPSEFSMFTQALLCLTVIKTLILKR